MTIGGLKNTTSRLALVAAAGFIMGGMTLTPASAADLGGDCCADLEERVAELEATTARKGNRKVSLTISGWVSRDIGWYEDDVDGDEGSEWYSAGHGVSGSRIQFAGSAQLTANWTAGYTMRIRLNDDRTNNVLDAAGGAGNGGGGFFHDRNFVYLKNERLGTFIIGQAPAPTDGVANISLGGHGVVGDSAGTDWNGADIQGFDLEQGTHQAIAWISPTYRGFTFAVAWADLDIDSVAVGDDDAASDAWDFALRYAQEFGPIRLAAGIGYTVLDNDEGIPAAAGGDGNVMGSVALMHTPTGLNVSFAAGTEMGGGLLDDGADMQYWHVSGGINRDFTGYGNTSIFGEYGRYDYDLAGEDEVNMWGIGIVQHFDKAATELYIAYRSWESDNTVNAVAVDGDVRQLMAGMRIKF